MQPLHTARLLIRAWTDADADAAAFHRIWAGPQAMWWDHVVDAAESRRVLRRVMERSAAMVEGLGWRAVVERTRAVVVGGVMLQPAPYSDDVEIGYHVAHDAWGHGYATEAARALVALAFGVLELPRIVAAIQPDNFASRRVAEKLGMSCLGQVWHAGSLHDLFAVESRA